MEVRVIDEDEEFVHQFKPDESGRVDLEGLPPGALWDAPSGQLRFTPDFIQGGQSWTIRQRNGSDLRIEVRDSIQPPSPTILSSEPGPGFTLHRVRQLTDSFLDSPGQAGRALEAYVAVPTSPSPHPVRRHLHGFSPAPETLNFGSPTELIVHPQDLANTYWWGYADSLPDPSGVSGTVPNYSQRRALHLLEWALKQFDGDPERVHIQGASMGGAGAATLGLLSARHFAWVDSRVGQMIARNHRPSRITQLASFWGTPEQALTASQGSSYSVWDEMDLSRALHEDPGAQNQFLFLKHSKDDRIIHFGAVTQPSPLTGESFYQSLQSQQVGHLAVWDEGGHMSSDPELGPHWWDEEWNPTTDGRTYLRRSLAFPAFSKSSANDNPGTGGPRDSRPWHSRAGYAGKREVPGDTGWDGDRSGALSRFLRWDSTGLVDAFDRFEIPLGLDGAQALPSSVITADVTVRRAQRFRPRPGEQLGYEFGEITGKCTVTEDGLVLVQQLPITQEWHVLRLVRVR